MDEHLEAQYEEAQAPSLDPFFEDDEDEGEYHDTGMRPETNDNGAPGFVSDCECGWEGPFRLSMGSAHNDAANHQNEMGYTD